MDTLNYRIVVKGRLSHRFDASFEGMILEPEAGRTTLVGEVSDQAQLYGILNRLADLGIELVSVNSDPAPAHADGR